MLWVDMFSVECILFNWSHHLVNSTMLNRLTELPALLIRCLLPYYHLHVAFRLRSGSPISETISRIAVSRFHAFSYHSHPGYVRCIRLHFGQNKSQLFGMHTIFATALHPGVFVTGYWGRKRCFCKHFINTLFPGWFYSFYIYANAQLNCFCFITRRCKHFAGEHP